jgi:hypothetical protein
MKTFRNIKAVKLIEQLCKLYCLFIIKMKHFQGNETVQLIVRVTCKDESAVLGLCGN